VYAPPCAIQRTGKRVHQKVVWCTRRVLDCTCTRRVPLSKTRTLPRHVYVYVYVRCTCMRSVRVSETRTLLVQYTSSTPNHPLVYQPLKVYPPPLAQRGYVHPPEFSQQGSHFTAELVYEHCTRRVPLSKTRTLCIHVYVYVYAACRCMRSVQLLQSGTRLVHVQSSTRLVHQTTFWCTRFQMRWMARWGAYTLSHQA
jgi:hypothetical protein